MEDEADIRNAVREFLNGEMVAGRPLNVLALEDFDHAIAEIRLRRADLLILDVFRGKVTDIVDEAGLRVLDEMKATGFVSAILYTAHPERVKERASHFIRVVGKEAKGLERLRSELDALFELRVPQIYRAVVTHLDETLRDYMWHFVEHRWDQLAPIAGHPEFLRVVLQRLAASLSSNGVERITDLVFGVGTAASLSPDSVHPAELYIMPPLSPGSAQLGDVRVRQTEKGDEFLVVLWPSCDMVRSATRQPKTERIHVAVAERLDATPEVIEWRAAPAPSANKKAKAVKALLRNDRSSGPDRYHAIPGLLDIPDLVVDFQNIEVLRLEDVCAMACRATLTSPYAESLSARYVRYLGRLGTPDVDTDVIMRRLQTGLPIVGTPSADQSDD